MSERSICIMLIDDNPDDNFFHERGIKAESPGSVVVTQNTAMKALDYLKSSDGRSPRPDLIFLDINMPGMNGWEFLEEYGGLSDELRRAIIIMLTTSENPDDLAKAKECALVSDYRFKPLTEVIMREIREKYFRGRK